MIDELAWARWAARTGVARSIREQAGLSLTEMASNVGVSPSCISRWERGTRRPTGKAAERWALALRSVAGSLPS